MKKLLAAITILFIAGSVQASVTKTAPSGKPGCLSCHDGIADIRDEKSAMMIQIKAIGSAYGDPEGCVTCHGGDPTATDLEYAHKGSPEGLRNGVGPQAFYPDPGSVWVAERACGQCHTGYAYRVERSLMNTEAGKIQENLHTWGIAEVQEHKVPWGNYDVLKIPTDRSRRWVVPNTGPT